MTYDVIRLAAEKLSYREKMKLSQYLIQAAIKEEEELHPEKRIATSSTNQKTAKGAESKENTIDYIKERLFKSKPSKKQSLSNFIGAMFQFQGGIKNEDIDSIVNQLVKENFITIDEQKITYNSL
jgi:hypothetical protein